MDRSNEDAGALLSFLREIIPFEASRGQLEASHVSARILSRIPNDTPDYVRLACAIEAVEEHDYAVWPQEWLISSFPSLLNRGFAAYFPKNPLTKTQSDHYEELYHNNPTLLKTVTHGFTRKLSMNDRSAFVAELRQAGRRESPRADEQDSIFEANVLHVALSYKHFAPFTVGTIDQGTAEEAFDIILGFDEVTKETAVRVWIDQNLHRYSHHGPWYERGFLPYAILRVITCLGKHGGFGIGRTRPWIWVETSVALCANGIFCSPNIVDTIEEIMDYSDSERVWSAADNKRKGVIPGASLSLMTTLRESLKVVSLWTADILEHAGYEYLESFKEFGRWAKAQLVRLQNRIDLDLNTDMFQDTLLENIAWLRSMCHHSRISDVNGRRVLRHPSIRLEMKSDGAQDLVSLLKASATYEIVNDRTEFLSGSGGVDVFCLKKTVNTTTFNVTPTRDFDLRVLANDPQIRYLEGQIRCFAEYQGGCTIWDSRFPHHRPPKLTRCGTIFGRDDEMSSSLGLGRVVNLGGRSFASSSFMLNGFSVQRVYQSSENGEVAVLSESDVLCMQELSEDLQRRLVSELLGLSGRQAVARIVRTEVESSFRPSPYTMGTQAKEILSLERKHKYRNITKPGELLIWRVRLSLSTFMLVIYDEQWGHAFYSFESLAPEGIPMEPLPSFRTGGDINKTVEKIRLMMGSKEFSEYRHEGLSLGILNFGGTNGLYRQAFVLHGSEFHFCPQCEVIYSPVNGRVAVLSSFMLSKLIQVKWKDIHPCHVVGEPCDIHGTTA